MLANGITLGYKTTGNDYTILKGLKEVPEFAIAPEKIDNTCLEDKIKQYEYGVAEPGDLDFKFKYDNSNESSAYRILRKLADDKSTISFQETLPDGTKFKWDAQINIKFGGGAVNGVLEFTVSMLVQSEIGVTDPVKVQ